MKSNWEQAYALSELFYTGHVYSRNAYNAKLFFYT